MTPNENESITTFISEATAILLADCNHRKKLRDEIRSFYNIRSKIVHRGKRDINHKDVEKLRHITLLLLLKMIEIKDKVGSTEELVRKIQESIKNQKLRSELNLN